MNPTTIRSVRFFQFQLAHSLLLLAMIAVRPAPATTDAAAEAHLATAAPTTTSAAIPTVQPASCEHVAAFQQPGRYGGWPANGGIWNWGNEIVVDYTAAWFKHATNDHAVDRSKPFEKWQSRSLDGGQTWTAEKVEAISAPVNIAKMPALAESIDFTAPDFALQFQFGSMHVGPSWFFISNDRCHTWRGPYAFVVEGITKITARTDYIVLGKHDCMMFGSAAKANDKEGRSFCARTTDGGLTWKLAGLIGPEPEGFAIMPSSLQLKDGALLTTIRNGSPTHFEIEAWRSEDNGQHWTSLGNATGNIGGNPPALVRLNDGRICLSYGYRRKPFGARARISSDEGRTWGPEIILRDNGLTGDLGYPRSVVRPDGKVVTIYYFNGPKDEDRTIQATIWQP